MKTYDSLAEIYDDFTDAFDYSDYLKKCLNAIKKKPNGNLALDCGCGTGNLLSLLCSNFDCTGLDVSEEMLAKAAEKPELKDVNFVCQALEDIDLYGAYDYVFCSLDTLNHLTDKRDLSSFFSKIGNFTEPGGVFIFDVKTEEYMKSLAKTEIFEADGATLIWEAFWQKPYISHRLTFFSPEKGLYKKEESTVEERFYSDAEIKELMQRRSSLTFERSFLYKKERTVYIYRKKQYG